MLRISFGYGTFIMLQKKSFGQIFQFCQNGTFEPVHEIQIFFGQKHSFEAI